MRVVVALGGNALLKRAEPMTAENQRANVQRAAAAIAPIAEQHDIIVTHGNGPQVGLLALQSAAYTDVEAYPLDVLDSQTEGMIGYLIMQELGNLLPYERPFATLLTQIQVDPNDPAFENPTKPIGPLYSEAEAADLATWSSCRRIHNLSPSKPHVASQPSPSQRSATTTVTDMTMSRSGFRG